MSEADDPASTFQQRSFHVGEADLTVSPRSRDTNALTSDIYWFWQMHPRIVFLKSLPLNSVVLDFGAGNGSLFSTKHDYKPERDDQKFLAFDLFKGENFDAYDDFQVGNFEEHNLKWDAESCDGVMASHVLEHLQSPDRFFAECWRVLRPGGLIYAETPAPFTMNLPDSSSLRDQGLPMVASCFFEDDTHIRALPNELIAEYALKQGFFVDENGSARSDYFADSLMQYAIGTDDRMYGMFGFWAKVGWAQYLILRKPSPFDMYLDSITLNQE